MSSVIKIVKTSKFWSYEVMKREDEVNENEQMKNVNYLLMLLFRSLPSRTSSLDSSRMMILMFCINSLEIMGKLPKVLKPEQKQQIIEWIYSRQSVNGGFDGGSDSRTPPTDAQ
jgi:prenyltransferase beta subunit